MDNCIFCKIINGDLPSFKLYEDEDLIAMLDRFPMTPGHTLIIPKRHVENIFELDIATGKKIIAAALKIAGVLKSSLEPDGLNLHQSNGEAAGQTVFHFHLHLLPRYKNDSINFEMPKMDVSLDALEEIAKKIGKI